MLQLCSNLRSIESKLHSKPPPLKCKIPPKIKTLLYYLHLCSVVSDISDCNSVTYKGTPPHPPQGSLLCLQSVIKIPLGHTLEYLVVEKLRYKNINVNDVLPSISFSIYI